MCDLYEILDNNFKYYRAHAHAHTNPPPSPFRLSLFDGSGGGGGRPTMTESTPLFAGSAGDQWPVAASSIL